MRIGSKVQLASGGPEMTITGFGGGDLSALCEWDGGKDWFKIACLEVLER